MERDLIFTMDTSSIKFTISLSPGYERDLSHDAVRIVKLTSDPDTEVNRLWVVYDRCLDADFSGPDHQ